MLKKSVMLLFICIVVLCGCSRNLTPIVTTDGADKDHYKYLTIDFSVTKKEPKKELYDIGCTGYFSEIGNYYFISGRDCAYQIHKSLINVFPQLKNCKVNQLCRFSTGASVDIIWEPVCVNEARYKKRN